MQQPNRLYQRNPRVDPVPYFCFGPSSKTSLIAHYCRENGYKHLKNPILSDVQGLNTNSIIEGSLQLFTEIQSKVPFLEVIFLGSDLSKFSEKERKIRNEYMALGKCKRVTQQTQSAFRRALYPNLIFVYGPLQSQIAAAGQTLAFNIGYEFRNIPDSVNDIINNWDKANNYVVCGMFLHLKENKVLEQYFNFRIVHFQVDRDQMPEMENFFDREIEILKVLRNKPQYHQVNGSQNPVKVMDDVGIALCPELIYINKTEASQTDYINKYIDATDGLLLGIVDIVATKKRKSLQLSRTPQQRVLSLTSTIFKDLSRKQVILVDFPFHTQQFVFMESVNRKFKCFVDLQQPKNYEFNNEYSAQIYFLEEQRRITPHKSMSLREQLTEKTDYWLVQGPSGIGRTTVAKYIAQQYGYKLIEFEPFVAGLKQKLLTPEDGQQLPVKKVCEYVKKMLQKDRINTTYIFDGLTYQGGDLDQWLRIVGPPNVANLKADPNDIIRRTRKKAEADLTAQVSQQQMGKAKESVDKNGAWISKVSEQCNQARVFQIDYSMPQLLSEQIVNSVLRPRVFLVQNHESIIFQNLAIRHEMGFINLIKNRLRECLPIARHVNKRDIILCYYGQDNQSLVSEDMYWIERNIGPIRYLCIWENEQKEIQEQKLQLVRPVKEQKPKKPEGQQGEENNEPPAQEEEGEKKKVLDIYQFEWTKPANHKNLSQWFLKLKKNITQREQNARNSYHNFADVLSILNQSRANNVYQRIAHQ